MPKKLIEQDMNAVEMNAWGWLRTHIGQRVIPLGRQSLNHVSHNTDRTGGFEEEFV